jgi:hypothetical protein
MNATDILKYPSFLKGIARIADTFGTLDEYKYSEEPDAKLLQRDWEIAGDDLLKALKEYEQKPSSQRES